ncbi:MAG: VWA domain-containing protein [Candidatus Thermoplasmatota archaeon]|nr:VWA domain-containing protein [Candidatus Thermoplasmatota archaeon]
MAGFEDPLVLLFLISLPLLYLIYRSISAKRKKAAMKFSHLGFIKTALGDRKRSRRGELLFFLMLVMLSLMIIGLANPHIPLDQAKEGVNVVLVLDISGSMQATDYEPSRIQAAKASAEILLQSLKPKDHAGIVTFESGATTAAYLSPYKENVIDKLRSITVKQGRTAIGDGLALGIDMASSIPNKKKVVILLSDGVNNAGVISPAEAIEFAKLNQIQVYSIGMGSDGKTILGYDWAGNPIYAELDEATLQTIAIETGGEYYKSVDTQTLDAVYEGIGENIERETEETNIKDWFFLSAILLLLVQFYLRYGKGMIIQ